MKKISVYILTLAWLAGSFSGCDNNDPPTVSPSVELSAGVATDSTLSFTLTPHDARSAAYAVVRKGETGPDAAAIFRNGTAATAEAVQEYVVLGLEAATEYVIAAAASNGDALSDVALLEMTTAARPFPDRPSVKVIPGAIGYDTLAFSVECSEGVDRGAYVCLKKGADVPKTAEEIFGTGTPIDLTAEKVVAEGLEGDTEYVIAVAVAAGDALSDIAAAGMTTGDTRDFKPLYVYAAYTGNNLIGEDKTVGQYRLNFTDAELDEYGYLCGAGYLFGLTFYSDLYPLRERHAVPAPGEYAFGAADTYQKWIIDPVSAFAQTDSSGQYLASGAMENAALTISNPSEGVYALDAYVECKIGKFSIHWNGPLEWENRTPPPAENLDFTATYASFTYSGPTVTDPTVDSWQMYLYDNVENPKAFLSVPFYTRNLSDPENPTAPVGSYTIGVAGVPGAGTFEPGAGSQSGSYFKGYTADDGIFRELYVNGGSFTISAAGGECRIDCDFTVDAGTEVSSHFSGIPELNSTYVPPVKDGLVVNAIGTASAGLFYYGYGETNTYSIQLVDCDFGGGFAPPGGGPGNKITISIYSDTTPADMTNITVPDGAYTWADSQANGTFGSFCYHWDEDGKFSVAEAVSGTLTVSRSGNVYTLNLEGKMEDGSRYACVYEGEIPMKDAAAGA